MIVRLALGLITLGVIVDTVILEAHLDDPELYVEYTTPTNVNGWWKQTSQAQHTGFLFAGRTEFPWIVDIRHVDLDQERWSTGNLMTSIYVLTTCRSVGEWVYQIKENDKALCINQSIATGSNEVDAALKCDPKNNNTNTAAPWWRLHYSYFKGLKVSYAPIYLWEDYKYKKLDEYEPFVTRPIFPNITDALKKKVKDKTATDEELADLAYSNEYFKVRLTETDESGSRNAIQLYRHTWCNQETVEYDIGLIKMQKGIWPVTNVISIMPINYDVAKSVIPEVDLQFADQQRRVCYVAAWGRSFSNWDHHMVVDYKVKYRVYYASLYSDCNEARQLRNFQRIYKANPVKIQDDGFFTNRIWCFKSRAKIGAVCDHDRGAPLVCDGEVYGMVVRGVRQERCSNLVGQAFLVMRISEMNEYWQSITKNSLNPKYVNVNFLFHSDIFPPLGNRKPHKESLGTTNAYMMSLMSVSLVLHLLLSNQP